MLTDTVPMVWHCQTRNFALRGLAWSLALFGVVRLGWFETHALWPLTQLQAQFAARSFGSPALPIEITLACSGADAVALCMGAIAAYPARWRMRAAGAALAIGLILVLNIIRIGTLGRAGEWSQWQFAALHEYVWPALLTLAIGGYVFTWMRVADRHETAPQSQGLPARHGAARPLPVTRRFAWVAVASLVIFTAASPLYLESPWLLQVATFVASMAAIALRVLGVDAIAAGNIVSTARGAFLVTQECISTPLIPVYFAAIVAYVTSWPARAAAVAAAAPLFVGLAVARLLVIAIPATLVASPVFLIHAFYQLVLAVVIVGLVSYWRHGATARAWRRALLACGVGGAVGYASSSYTRLFESAFSVGAALPDPQGALAFLPPFQIGLYGALSVAGFLTVRWRPFAGGLALLALTQVMVFAALQRLVEVAGVLPEVREIRAWAIAGPLFVVIAIMRLSGRAASDSEVIDVPPPPAASGAPQVLADRRFWTRVGTVFPDLGNAASTRYYADNERRLFTEHFPSLIGLRILKTDLWDEAKNTRILEWASRNGACAYGVDISDATVRQARAAFHPQTLRCAVSDVRALPFRDASVDAIYSMGTIEHFDETEQAVDEIARVLKPGGYAIVGVPNRHDPFLRPILAAALQAIGLYAYGYEKSYSRRALREMLERAGLPVVAETAILFMPGWLRMLDLACHSWCRPLARVTAACVWPFILLDRHVPAVRRHGYLLATVVRKCERLDARDDHREQQPIMPAVEKVR